MAGSIFISHSSKDKAAAQRLCEALEQMGLRCWMAPRDIPKGASYASEIIKALETCAAVIVLVTRQSNGSEHVETEVERAVDKRKPVFPVLLETVKLSPSFEFFLSKRQWTELHTAARDQNLRELGTQLQTLLGQPVTAGATPRGRRFRPAWAAALGLLATLVVIGGLYLGLRAPPPGPAVRSGGAVAPAEPTQPEPARRPAYLPTYRAIAIGISDYAERGAESWDDLRTARADAESFASLLESDYRFSVTRLLDQDATRARILDVLSGLSASADNEAVLIYFAGHGFYDAALHEGYWIPADARKTADGRLCKEDWIWNSMLSKIIAAAPARHVLVMADSCYSGSLFRDAQLPPAIEGIGWYQRALLTPSRYVITSGDLEPVLDGTARHSVFAQQLLGALGAGARPLVSASELFHLIRPKISELTHQMPRAGPLADAADAGGDFVFVHKNTQLPDALPATLPGTQERPRGAGATADARLRQALALAAQGAEAEAKALMEEIAKESGSDNRLVNAVARHLEEKDRQADRAELRTLIETVDAMIKTKDGAPASNVARPRIVACLGPTGAPGLAEDVALLYRIGLRAELGAHSKARVIERQALADILAEHQLANSNLANEQAAPAVGRLLPASLLLLGDVTATQHGEKLYLRLVDTETSEIVGNVSIARTNDMEVSDLCAQAASQLTRTMIEIRPLRAPVAEGAEGRLTVNLGRFHGVARDDRFALITPDGDKELGSATVTAIRDQAADLQPTWTTPPPSPLGTNVWAREVPPESEPAGS